MTIVEYYSHICDNLYKGLILCTSIICIYIYIYIMREGDGRE